MPKCLPHITSGFAYEMTCRFDVNDNRVGCHGETCYAHLVTTVSPQKHSLFDSASFYVPKMPSSNVILW